MTSPEFTKGQSLPGRRIHRRKYGGGPRVRAPRECPTCTVGCSRKIGCRKVERDWRMIRLIRKWLKAGILGNGIVNVVTGGQRQDAIAARLNSELLETEPAPEG